METKIDYIKKYQELIESAENELKEVLSNTPNQTYNFLTEVEEYELNDNADNYINLNVPVITMYNDFDGRTFSIYVTSVSLMNGTLVISGFEQPLYTDLEIRDYHPCEIYGCQIAEIFKYIK